MVYFSIYLWYKFTKNGSDNQMNKYIKYNNLSIIFQFLYILFYPLKNHRKSSETNPGIGDNNHICIGFET
ncbi:hypothetical protein D0T87_14865 [Bacteroides sp. 51]|nr:hypothetical protein [Bacteroides sp. 51]